MNIDARAANAGLCSPAMLTALHLGLIMLLGLACYCNTFSVPLMFDDFSSIVKNPDITGGKSLWDILLHGGSRRIADMSFILNYRAHGLELAGYHSINLAIHLTVTVVLYFLTTALLAALVRLNSAAVPASAQAGPLTERFIPLATALIFVCHPLQTQAVTYIVQRHTSLATLFYLLALLAYLKGRIALEQYGVTAHVLLRGLLLALLSLLAFHTKQITYTLPLMIVMLELSLFRGRQFKRLLGVTALITVLLLITLIVPALLGGSLTEVMFDLRHATSEDLYFTRSSYALTQLRVVVTYLRLLIVPLGQNLDYDYPLSTSLLNIDVMASLFLHITLLTTAFLLYRRSQCRGNAADGHGRSALRLIAIGITWFYLALMVESSFIPITDVIMEHRVYLPSVGFCLAAAALLRLLCRRLQNGWRWQWLALTAICLVFSVMTVARNHVWSDDLRFWQDAADKSPRKGRVVSNLGIAHLKRGQYQIALRLFVEAIKLDMRLESAWFSLGWTLKGMDVFPGRFSTGEEYMSGDRTADMRWYRQRNSSEFNNMGLSCEFVGEPEHALKWYVQSVSMNPDFDLAWYNLGLLAARLGNTAQSEAALLKLKKLNPALAGILAGYIRPG